MKLLHISDLHIGKRVNEFSMLEDQKYILEQFLTIVEEENPDGILIGGDVYDKSQPSVEAVELLDEFLTILLEKGKPVFMISGNHDSPERLGFGSRIMRDNGLYIAGQFDGTLRREILSDEYGKVNIYLLPFIKPAMLRPFYEEKIESYNDAIHTIVTSADINRTERNILIAHQFVTSGVSQPERSESESISIGGLDNVNVAEFEDFDYVALGHLHGPQRIGRDTVRYAGSPLKYSFSEVRQKKAVTRIELKDKGEILINQIPLIPLRDMRKIKGPIEELLNVGKEDELAAKDYIHATLCQEEEIFDAVGQLRQVYPNLMALEFDNRRSNQAFSDEMVVSSEVEVNNPLQLFANFYETQNLSGLTEEQNGVMREIFDKAGGLEQ